MSRYENLMMNYDKVFIHETSILPDRLHGLTLDGGIIINSNIDFAKKLETLSEEIGHLMFTYGDITRLNNVLDTKFELKARRYGYEQVVSLNDIIESFYEGIQNLYEMSKFLEVTEQYAINALKHYRAKYGSSVYHDGHLIILDPLQVFRYEDID